MGSAIPDYCTTFPSGKVPKPRRWSAASVTADSTGYKPTPTNESVSQGSLRKKADATSGSIAGADLLSGLVWLFAAVAGGALMAMSLALPGWRWGGWFALMPLFLAIYQCRPIVASLLGAAWGISVYAVISATSANVLAPGVTSLALLALAPAVFALFGAHLTRWIGFSAISLGVAWMGVEFMLRPIGLNHGLLGSTLIDGALGQWIGQALGYVCVACLVAWINATFVILLAKVCATIAASTHRTCPAGLRNLRIPRIEFSYSNLAILCSRPRAPPVSCVDHDVEIG